MRLTLKNKRFTSYYTPVYLASLKVMNHYRPKWTTFQDKVKKYYWKNWRFSFMKRKWRKKLRLRKFIYRHFFKQKKRRKRRLQKFKNKNRSFILKPGLRRRYIREWYFLSRYFKFKYRRIKRTRKFNLKKLKKLNKKKEKYLKEKLVKKF